MSEQEPDHEELEQRDRGTKGRRLSDYQQVDLVVAAALSDVKVELAQLNTSITGMSKELTSQDAQHRDEIKRLEEWQRAQDQRLVVVEKWQWRVTGIAVAVGSVAGLLSTLLANFFTNL